MPLLRLDKISINFGTQILLDDVDFTFRRGEKIGLLGRNGTGKTTLLKTIAGAIQADSGERWLRQGVELAWLDQSLLEANELTVYEVVAGGLSEIGELLSEYHRLIHTLTDSDMARLHKLQEGIEARDGWRLNQRVESIISQLQLPIDQPMAELSGGWRRRVALARALIREPDILLLDEPTNHLDIPAIKWLETQLLDFGGALLLVTHDRAFLQNVATSIVELDRGKLHYFDGSYKHFIEAREHQLVVEERANQLFDKKLAQEEVWIRQGIKARRTRNEGRVRSLEAMRDERQQRRQKQKQATFGLESGDLSGKIVSELIEVSHSYGGVSVIDNYSSVVMRGERIGLVGINGVGKTTFLKILLGKLKPDLGSVKLGSKLEVAYFDQLREQLNPELDLIGNICGGQSFIEIDGKMKHAISYLGDFLFTPDRIRTPVKVLSGGEQNRAILAKLFSKPNNILVLDEPTNDLDIETLELLEEILINYTGTVLLVSHDREFMDNVVTSLLVFEGNGQIVEHAGGFSDWEARGGNLTELQDNVAGQNRGSVKSKKAAVAASTLKKSKSKTNVSYKVKRELDKLPQKIEKLEQAQTKLEQKISNPDFYNGEKALVQETLAEMSNIQNQLEASYQRWEELENAEP